MAKAKTNKKLQKLQKAYRSAPVGSAQEKHAFVKMGKVMFGHNYGKTRKV